MKALLLISSLPALLHVVHSQIVNCNRTATESGKLVCLECFKEYKLSVDKQSCVSCPPGCQSCDNLGKCLECNSGSYLVAGTGECKICLLHCGQCQATVCQKCISGFSLSGDKSVCIQCPTDCKECSSTTVCTTCNDNFELKEKDGAKTCQVAEQKGVVAYILGGIAAFFAALGSCCQSIGKECKCDDCKGCADCCECCCRCTECCLIGATPGRGRYGRGADDCLCCCCCCISLDPHYTKHNSTYSNTSNQQANKRNGPYTELEGQNHPAVTDYNQPYPQGYAQGYQQNDYYSGYGQPAGFPSAGAGPQYNPYAANNNYMTMPPN
jgi:proprotein convertase subtilisin/kexin type 5